jgi:putative tricarboxylic transport membrane protein
MRLAYQITGIILLSVALFLGYEASRLTYDTAMGPGPGFFPLWLCGLLGLLALAMLLQATFGKPEPRAGNFFAAPLGYFRIAVAVAGLLATAALMNTAGFSITIFLFYVVLLTALGRRNPVEITAFAALGSFGVYYLFSQLLSRPLPRGPFL